MPQEWMTVAKAAEALGITQDAVRKRAKRDAIEHGKDDKDRLIVLVDTDETSQDKDQERRQDTSTVLVEELRDRIRFLERQLDRRDRELDDEREARTEERRRADMLTARLMDRLPELEAPTSTDSPPDGPGSAEPRSDRGTPPPQEPETATERPWWRRVFGG